MYFFFSDSLIYNVTTDDFYRDLAESSDLLGRMDTANLPRDHPCYVAERKKIPGFFSDETDGRTMFEFVALRAKSYAYIVEGSETIKAKGIRWHVVKNHMTFDDHKQCLLADMYNETDSVHDESSASEITSPYRENVSIRSFKHQLMTIKTIKLALNSFDDKRVVLNDCIQTLAHGHYKTLDK